MQYKENYIKERKLYIKEITFIYKGLCTLFDNYTQLYNCEKNKKV